MSRAVQRAQARLQSLVQRQAGRIDTLARDFARELEGLTPAELREVIAGTNRREVARFLSLLSESITAAKRQGAFLGARTARLGDRTAAKWLERNTETISARFAQHIHTQGRQMTRDLLGSVSRVISEGKSATEAARRIRDELGHVPVVKISEVASDLVESARGMVLAVGDDAAIDAYRADLARMRSKVRRLGQMHDTSDKLAYGMRASAQQLVSELERAIRTGRTDLIDRAVYYHGYDKRAYHQRMIARTEMSEAYHGAYLETQEDAPWIVGQRWMLSTGKGHKHDVCDELATANKHKLGPGGYPMDKLPAMPAHPHCRCYWEPIVDESKG